MAEQNPSSQSATAEEDLALADLLAGEKTAGGGLVKAASKDDEAKALEALLSSESEGPEAIHKENQALDDLLAAEGRETKKSGQRRGASAPESADDGIITLKEVVALTGAPAEEALSDEDRALDALVGTGQSGTKNGNRIEGQPSPVPVVEQAEGMKVSGLSREEKDDLDKLIKGLKEEPSAGISPVAIAELQKQVMVMKKRVIQLTRLASEYDKRMKTCSEIMRLFYQKSEIMNKRIDAIADLVKGGTKG